MRKAASKHYAERRYGEAIKIYEDAADQCNSRGLYKALEGFARHDRLRAKKIEGSKLADELDKTAEAFGEAAKAEKDNRQRTTLLRIQSVFESLGKEVRGRVKAVKERAKALEEVKRRDKRIKELQEENRKLRERLKDVDPAESPSA